MTTIDPEIERLAQQRRDDLAEQHNRDITAATLAGRREAERAQESADTKRHFDVINGSIADTAKALATLTAQVHDIREEQARRDAVNTALIESATGQGAARLNRYQILGIVLMALIALASLLVAVAQVVTGG